MRRISVLRALVLAALLCVLSLPALADECVRCGSETGCEDYLCTACLVELLEGEPVESPLRMDRVRRNYDGSVIIQWSDSEGNAPYRVMYELLDSAPVPFGWTDCEATTRRQHIFDRLVPGTSYILTVMDSKGNTVEYPYYAKLAEEKNDIGLDMTVSAYLRRPSAVTKYGPLSLSEFAGNEHLLHVSLDYSRLAYGRLIDFHLAIQAPNGFTDVVYSGGIELGDGRTHLADWSQIPLDSYFSYLSRYYGGIPAGEYTALLFFNGSAAAEGTFEVVE